ncbi:hypothetical protein DL240_12190 [Lujinxingia litoralis]|uniref:Major facilitator superfamily (MFS) profile domain-containing protein n=1 Tax=Lujinxingia litoralis TaxID=2211119 RepID=A0A328C9H0_9DELT|nr:MFS transporter [Lujinxingia litoralis]RAL21610.1 hypothetical protein DL240_12190 [Lujinxingia litoralis]
MTPRSPIRRLFPILLLNITGFAIAIPVLPALAEALGGTAVDVGLLYATQSLGQFLMAPVWGRLSDRLGRKPVLMATFAAAALLELLTALTQSLPLLYVARFVAGLCAGNVATASALIADSTDARGRSRGMAVIGISFGLGFTLGPALGAIAGTFAQPGAGLLGAGLPFAASAVLSLITFVLAAFVLVEPPANEETRRANRVRYRPARVSEHLKSPPILALCALFFVYTVALAVLEGTFFLYMSATYGYDIVEVGFIFAGMGIAMAIFQGGVGPISRRLGDRRMTGLGLAALALGLAIAPLYPSLIYLFATLGIATIGRALVHPGILALTSRQAEAQQNTGQIMGILQSSASLGRIAGPAAGGVLFAALSPAAPFVLSGILLAASGLAWWVLWPRINRTANA